MSATSAAVLESVNAVNLASRMGIGLDTLSRAIGADPVGLNNHPRDPKFQDKLRVIADLWKDILVFSGDEERARSFLRCPLQALRGNSPMYYLEQRRPGVVQGLIHALREMLP